MCIRDSTYTVTAMKETLERSNLGLLKVGDKVNVERSMMTVSYTHLDVYKRQAHEDLSDFFELWGFFIPGKGVIEQYGTYDYLVTEEMIRCV